VQELSARGEVARSAFWGLASPDGNAYEKWEAHTRKVARTDQIPASYLSTRGERKCGRFKGMRAPMGIQEGRSSMDTIQHESNHIQKREHTAQVALSLLVLAAFFSTILPVSLARSPEPFLHAISSPCWLPLSFCLLFFPILLLGISQLRSYLQETQRQKQCWLNEYGQQILAHLTRQPEENAFIIGGRARGRGSSSLVYLDWQDPQAEQHYTFQVNTRFSSAFRNLPEGVYDNLICGNGVKATMKKSSDFSKDMTRTCL
jgi:hypothetical protein